MGTLQRIDKFGLGLYLLLCVFAIANIYSVNVNLGEKQLLFFIISLLGGAVVFVGSGTVYENFAIIFYAVGMLLLIGLFPFGKEILGQKNWYKFGSFNMQPVEFAKASTALMLASYASRADFDLKNKKTLFTSVLIVSFPAAVVLMIPDAGSLLVFFSFFIVLYREGLSGWFFVITGILGGVFLVSIFLEIYGLSKYYIILPLALFFLLYLFFNVKKISKNLGVISAAAGVVLVLVSLSYLTPMIYKKLPKHQKQRIEVLIKGEREFRDTSGYNLLYSKTAIGSGGFLGKGFMEGSVTRGKFVPEQQTDYIFCTVGEEWGFLGSSLLIVGYTLFIGRIYYLAERQKFIFNRVFGYSFASVLFVHFVINIGMVMGLFPTVGIPLPYFSYGGSSLLAFSLMAAVFFKLDSLDKDSLI